MSAQERGYWVLGQEAPRYCHDGKFIRGFQATSAKEALEKAQATKNGKQFFAVVEYEIQGKDIQMKVIYPEPVIDDSIPF